MASCQAPKVAFSSGDNARRVGGCWLADVFAGVFGAADTGVIGGSGNNSVWWLDFLSVISRSKVKMQRRLRCNHLYLPPFYVGVHVRTHLRTCIITILSLLYTKLSRSRDFKASGGWAGCAGQQCILATLIIGRVMVVILCGDERRQDRGANGDERGGQHGCCAVCVVGLKIGLLWYSHFAFVWEVVWS